MYYGMEISERLKQARQDAGFSSASAAATNFGWTSSTYAAHENATRGMKLGDIEKYATAFRVDPSYIAFGTSQPPRKIAGVSDRVLAEVVRFVMSHEGASKAPAEEVAELIVDLCHHVSQSGDAGLGEIVDFQMRRAAALGR